jgi:hypothetical protein
MEPTDIRNRHKTTDAIIALARGDRAPCEDEARFVRLLSAHGLFDAACAECSVRV